MSKTKFIKCQDTIVRVNDIRSVYRWGQSVIIECDNDEHDIYFSSEQEAEEELYRIYNLIN